ncbi:MAG: hypothetical protein A2669_01180 [Candidatus Yanofskybacteria bacterium RIFCSPHIGHO2_01_FULL_48_25b]|uniref:Peptidase S11 D-alanyl-D-alanine carboxypeptidase A N-terminal domain-containing protein n=1 Tax=Candidatus Yanofskybacteria bacterium RIFCSPHIGHO2_01_FULL_48_25b TaxID=1802672 RepID=A0A1F8EYM0_9BACT|nr:MAG: hypothetical protein A2669_01180 [Candidatus Yanofskybacteria bacterium RIFCSPHIGHO2_01_FULL_48_25b]
MNLKSTGLVIIVSILVLVNAYFFITVIRGANNTPGPIFNTTQAFIEPPNQVTFSPVFKGNSGSVELDAKSAVVYDLKADRNLYEKNIKEKLPVASLTKILNAIVVWEKFSPSDEVTISPSSIKVDGERQDLYAGETLTVNSLVKLMLVESSNDAAYALRDFAAGRQIDLVGEMNTKALGLGMRDTLIKDPAGLDDSAYSTVSDLVKAVRYALRYDPIWSFSRQATTMVVSVDGKISHEIKNTNQLLGVLPDIIGGKTGYTEGSLGCIILIIDMPSGEGLTSQNDKIIAVILGSRGRFEDMKKLVAWTKSSYQW